MLHAIISLALCTISEKSSCRMVRTSRRYRVHMNPADDGPDSGPQGRLPPLGVTLQDNCPGGQILGGHRAAAHLTLCRRHMGGHTGLCQHTGQKLRLCMQILRRNPQHGQGGNILLRRPIFIAPQGRLQGSQRHFIHPHGRVNGWDFSRSRSSRLPTRIPAWGPPSNLSPEKDTTSTPAATEAETVGSPRRP